MRITYQSPAQQKIFKNDMDYNEPKVCQGKEIFERMNYLYQASRLIAKSSKVTASYYGNLMIGCSKKSVLRMEPNVKRTMCKCCRSPLIPGDTAIVRLVSKPVKAVKWKCLLCKTTTKIPTKKGHKLWLDEPESVVQLFDYTPKTAVQTCCKPSSGTDAGTENPLTTLISEKEKEPMETDKT